MQSSLTGQDQCSQDGSDGVEVAYNGDTSNEEIVASLRLIDEDVGTVFIATQRRRPCHSECHRFRIKRVPTNAGSA